MRFTIQIRKSTVRFGPPLWAYNLIHVVWHRGSYVTVPTAPDPFAVTTQNRRARVNCFDQAIFLEVSRRGRP